MMSPIDAAIDLAVRSHRGQIDKGGQPYILHPLRVMMRGKSHNEMIVGVLHDVVEDCEVQLSAIQILFGDDIAEAVDAISHRDNEPNAVYIRRVIAVPLAAVVKMYDIEDNSLLERMRVLDARTAERMTKKHDMMLDALRRAGY